MKTMKQLMTERMTKIDIVPTPGQGQGQADDYTNPASPAEKAFKDKHVVQKTDYPVPQKGSTDDIFSGAKQSKKKRIADQDKEQAVTAYEAAINDKAEDIVKGMKKNKSSFVQRYGKDAESVMYATANKMAKEDVDATEFTLSDGSEVSFNDDEISNLSSVYEELNEKNRDVFLSRFVENRQSNEHLMMWVKEICK